MLRIEDVVQNMLLKGDGKILRVIDVRDDSVFIIDCIRRTIPDWADFSTISCLEPCTEDDLCAETGMQMRALQKKGTKLSVLQQNENHKAITGQVTESRGIIGGADSFTIIGESGIGKSSAIERSISMITGNKVIIAERPYCKVILAQNTSDIRDEYLPQALMPP